jgi:pimeloyl-ACP methyl ester carboxylesterase
MDALVRGVRIAYDDEGAGHLVVRLHGLTGSRASDDATGAFDADGLVRAGRRVVRFDARGHGRSGGEKVESDYAWPNLARDLLALLDELEVEEAVSGVGASMGTATLLHAVTLAPDRFGCSPGRRCSRRRRKARSTSTRRCSRRSCAGPRRRTSRRPRRSARSANRR